MKKSSKFERFDEVIGQLESDYVQSTNNVYSQVKAGLENDIYDLRKEVVHVDESIDSIVTDAVMEFCSENPEAPQVCRAEIRLGAGSALPQIYGIAVANSEEIRKIIRTLG